MISEIPFQQHGVKWNARKKDEGNDGIEILCTVRIPPTIFLDTKVGSAKTTFMMKGKNETTSFFFRKRVRENINWTKNTKRLSIVATPQILFFWILAKGKIRYVLGGYTILLTVSCSMASRGRTHLPLHRNRVYSNLPAFSLIALFTLQRTQCQ